MFIPPMQRLPRLQISLPHRIIAEDDGSAAVEYGVLLGLIALAVIGVIPELSKDLGSLYQFITEELRRIASL